MDKDTYQKKRDVLFGHCAISSMLRSNGGGTYFDQRQEEFESLQFVHEPTQMIQGYDDQDPVQITKEIQKIINKPKHGVLYMS